MPVFQLYLFGDASHFCTEMKKKPTKQLDNFSFIEISKVKCHSSMVSNHLRLSIIPSRPTYPYPFRQKCFTSRKKFIKEKVKIIQRMLDAPSKESLYYLFKHQSIQST